MVFLLDALFWLDADRPIPVALCSSFPILFPQWPIQPTTSRLTLNRFTRSPRLTLSGGHQPNTSACLHLSTDFTSVRMTSVSVSYVTKLCNKCNQLSVWVPVVTGTATVYPAGLKIVKLVSIREIPLADQPKCGACAACGDQRC